MSNDDDDDALRGVDLEAWAPPPPPAAGPLADAVVARLREPVGSTAHDPAAAVAVATVTAPATVGGGGRRRWPMAAAVAAVAVAVAAAGVLAIVHGGPARAPADSGAEMAMSLDQVKQEVRTLRERLDVAEQALAAPEPQAPQTPPSPQIPQTPPSQALADTLDRAAIARGLAGVNAAILACDDGSYRGTLTASVTVAPDGGVIRARLRPARTRVGGCVERALRAARFDATKRGGVLQEAFRFGVAPRPAPPASCDADELVEKGKELHATGQLVAALVALEAAYACRPDLATAEKAFVVACNIPHASKAALYYRRMTPRSRARALAICIRNGITEDMLDRAPPRPGTSP